MSTAIRVAQLLIEQATTTNNPLLGIIEGKDDHEVCGVIFSNYRGSVGKERGMKLTDVGLQLMKAFFKCYNVKLAPGYKTHPRHLIYLDRVNKMPYWLNDAYCAMFDSELAMVLTLANGDVQGLIDARFRLDHFGSALRANM